MEMDRSNKLIGDSFAYIVMGHISEVFEKVDSLYFENSGQFKMILKAKILFMAQEYGYSGRKDIRNEDTCEDNEFSYIDVVWRGNYGNNIVAFQISSSFHGKPVKRLREMEAVHKFWVYYGEEDIPFAGKVINEYGVHIVTN